MAPCAQHCRICRIREHRWLCRPSRAVVLPGPSKFVREADHGFRQGGFRGASARVRGAKDIVDGSDRTDGAAAYLCQTTRHLQKLKLRELGVFMALGTAHKATTMHYLWVYLEPGFGMFHLYKVCIYSTQSSAQG